MSPLFTVWLASLVVMTVLVILALVRKRSYAYMPEGFLDFISGELHALAASSVRFASRFAPHANGIQVAIVRTVSNGRDIFIERIFGRIESKPGAAVSFFLKHIAEHKESLRKDGEKVGY